MARNRKRAKDRRARRPQPVASRRAESELQAPDPIEHATPDAELAEAQVALGRPEIAEEADGSFQSEPDEFAGGEAGDELDADEDFGGDGDRKPPGGEELAVAGGTPGRPRAVPGNRLVNFIQGSWRELQRVQWPDRRQVMQATGVVIGFVIIAGVFLGVADFLAGKVMNYVLTGHFK